MSLSFLLESFQFFFTGPSGPPSTGASPSAASLGSPVLDNGSTKKNVKTRAAAVAHNLRVIRVPRPASNSVIPQPL